MPCYCFSPLLFWTGVKSDIQLECGTMGLLCLSTPVQYQCIVTISVILRWRIRDETITSLDTRAYTNGDDLSSTFNPIPDASDFSTDLSSTSPSIISNISFTVQSSINGYSVHCEDAGGDSENCTIYVAGKIMFCFLLHCLTLLL